MTRINLNPVHTLTQKHWAGEFKEITRPFNKVIKRIEKYGLHKALDNCDIPEQYTLGKGHESFFFNKLAWLFERYVELYHEGIARGVSLDYTKFREICVTFKRELQHTPYWNSYSPTPEEYYLNMARLVNRCKIDKVKEELGKEDTPKEQRFTLHPDIVANMKADMVVWEYKQIGEEL